VQTQIILKDTLEDQIRTTLGENTVVVIKSTK
jgi:hypothetical protein